MDPKHGDTVFALKGRATDEGLLPVWSDFQPKAKPLSLLLWSKAFVKFASVFVQANPDGVQHLVSYMYKMFDLATWKDDWAFYDREFRKDRDQASYSFSAHRVDLFTKALSNGTGDDTGTDTPYRSNSSYPNSNQLFPVQLGVMLRISLQK